MPLEMVAVLMLTAFVSELRVDLLEEKREEEGVIPFDYGQRERSHEVRGQRQRKEVKEREEQRGEPQRRDRGGEGGEGAW
jgi:hypothetical protein